MKKEIVNTEEAPAPADHYSQAGKCGNLFLISGLLGVDPQTGELIRSFRDLGPDGKRLKEMFRTALPPPP
jgi:enamine deaminase RidA (YjgF/YER057c/UK114 family)